MKSILTEQQTAFFTQNGYIEFELGLDPAPLFEGIRNALSVRLGVGLEKMGRKTAEEIYAAGRDLWRTVPSPSNAPFAETFPIAQTLSGKRPLRLGCDQWIPAGYPWEKTSPAKDLFSIQGLTLGLLIGALQSPPKHRSHLGLLPPSLPAGQYPLFPAQSDPRLASNWPPTHHPISI